MFRKRSGGPESVGLPEPARDVWLRTIKAVQTTLRETGTPRLGGGTLLAARWQHRKSLDIDLSFEPQGRHPQRIDSVAGRGSAFERTMLELGASEVEPRSARHVLVRFGDTTLDVSVLAARPHAGERGATVNGVPATVLSTVQILGGKLERSDRLLHRDAFDLRYAGRAERESLAKAVNQVDRGVAAETIGRWNRTGTRWAAEADDKLKSLTPAGSYDAATLGRETAEAIRNALYERVRITTHGRGGRFEAVTAGGTKVEVDFHRQGLEKTLAENGIEGYLQDRAPHSFAGHGDPLRKVRDHCRFGSGRRTVYEAEHRIPPTAAIGGRAGGDILPAQAPPSATKAGYDKDREPGRPRSGSER